MMIYPDTYPCPTTSSSSVKSSPGFEHIVFKTARRSKKTRAELDIFAAVFFMDENEYTLFSDFFDARLRYSATNIYKENGVFTCGWYIGGNANTDKILQIVGNINYVQLAQNVLRATASFRVLSYGSNSPGECPVYPENILYPQNLLFPC